MIFNPQSSTTMAKTKTCETCKKTYSAKLAACPHCAEAAKMAEPVETLGDEDVLDVVELEEAEEVHEATPVKGAKPHAEPGADEIEELDWAALEEPPMGNKPAEP